MKQKKCLLHLCSISVSTLKPIEIDKAITQDKKWEEWIEFFLKVVVEQAKTNSRLPVRSM